MNRNKACIDDLPEFVKGEIYLIRNKTTSRVYIGQTRTHIMNHGKYRPFGSWKRWQAHVSEAVGEYKHQSMKLNNAIRKYGSDDFMVFILETCEVKDLNDREKHYIALFDSIKNGYNLTLGGDKQFITEEGKQKVSDTLLTHFDKKKREKYKNVQVNEIYIALSKQPDKDIVLVYVRNDDSENKVDFGGKKRSQQESLERAKAFALSLTTKDKIKVQPSIANLLLFE
jgi:group I intron endonuclease